MSFVCVWKIQIDLYKVVLYFVFQKYIYGERIVVVVVDLKVF